MSQNNKKAYRLHINSDEETPQEKESTHFVVYISDRFLIDTLIPQFSSSLGSCSQCNQQDHKNYNDYKINKTVC